MIQFIARRINDALPAGYFADTNERVYVSEPLRGILPDVTVLERNRPSDVSPLGVAAGTAVLERTTDIDAPIYVTLSDAVREPYVEIFALGSEDRVVTAIEVLSPANKTAGSGREQRLLKQRQLMDSETHLLEIDLLRLGAPTPLPLPLSLSDSVSGGYAVCLHRAGRGDAFEVWPIALRGRLPRVSVPLAHGDPDVALDLQAVFDLAYDDSPYRKRVDYTQPATPPLNAADAEWQAALLRQAGLR